MAVVKVKRNGVWEEIDGLSGHTHKKNEIIDFPVAVPVPNANGNTPTAEEFNALLTALRNAGFIATK